jgi:hypothetical protein
MSAELTACEEFMRQACTGSSQLVAAAPGGFHSERQHSGSGRYVLWSYQGASNNTLGERGVRILSHPMYLVRVIDKVTSYLPLQPAADLLDQALTLTGPFGLVLNGHNYIVQSCTQQRPFSLTEHYVDVEWRHVGGYYEFEVSPY